MVRESKSAATIRRRRQKSPGILEATRPKAPHLEENLDSDDDDLDVSCLEPVTGPRVLRLIMSSEHTLFLGLLAFRVMNALILQTSYVPDEYWQSLEVAHNMAFGYGYMTWEWRYGLRGYLYPLMFAVPYKIFALLHIDNRIALIKLPRILQAIFAALGDLYLYKLSSKLGGVRVGRWSLLCQITSWFTFYCAPRTLTNSMETVLTTMAMYYYPWPGYARKAHWKYVSLAGLAVIIRPTAAIVWVPLCVWHLIMYSHVSWKVMRLFAEKGFLILSLSSIVDRLCYGKWVNVQYNFLEFNVLSNMGTFYGSHTWHWYLTQGLAVILGVQLFPFVLAVRKCMQPALIAVIAWTVGVYSCLGHKEFRFLLPILPLAMNLCGCYLTYLCDDTISTYNCDSSDSENQDSETELNTKPINIPSQFSQKFTSLPCSREKLLVVLLVLGNLPLALYTGLIHQRGTLDVMPFLDEEARKQPSNQSMSVLALMPCHSIPHYSYLHQNVTLRFLTCEPNLNNTKDYIDEADIFYQHPEAWLNTTFDQYGSNDQSIPPTHLVIFDVLQPRISNFTTKHQYNQCAKFFHTHAPEGRVGSYVIVMCSKVWQQAISSSQKQARMAHRQHFFRGI